MQIVTLRYLMIPALLLSSFWLRADFENISYSYLGVGNEILEYSETSDDFGGESFTTRFRSSNVIQKSGGYSAIGDRYGLFLATSSTLLSKENKEEWDFSGIGVVQESNTSLSHTMIEILGVMHFENGHFLTLGSRYNNVTFSRFDFEGTDLTEELNDALLNNLRGELQQDLDSRLTTINAARANGSTRCLRGEETDSACLGMFDNNNLQVVTLEEYWEERKFDPSSLEAVIFEDMTSWSLVFGWGYDSYVINQNPGFRYQFALRGGLAVYENVLNTNNNRSLSRDFGGDWDAHALAGVGYQFGKEFSIMLTAEANGFFRSEIKESGNSASLPENTLWSFSPQVTIEWNY